MKHAKLLILFSTAPEDLDCGPFVVKDGINIFHLDQLTADEIDSAVDGAFRLAKEHPELVQTIALNGAFNTNISDITVLVG